jgi:SAM-dependent methyltransferase
MELDRLQRRPTRGIPLWENRTLVDLVELPDRVVRRHPWEESRFEFFFRVLADSNLLATAGAVLDVGAGDAWFANQLAGRSAIRRIVCWDTGYTPEFLGGRQLEAPGRVELSAEKPSGAYGLFLLLDVLEHVEEDRVFLNTLVRDNLAPGGHALISVPAWPSLFSSHDVRLRHYRRYTPASARALIGSAGLEIIRSAGLFHSLWLPRAIEVARERLTGRSKAPARLEWNASFALTKFVSATLACDVWLSLLESRLGWSLPGLSWWALCRRRTSPAT